MKTTRFCPIKIAIVSLGLVVGLTLTTAGTIYAQNAGAMAVLTDVQAQALLLRASSQPNQPLTVAETQLLAQYFAAKNAQAAAASISAASSAAQMQAQAHQRMIVSGQPGLGFQPGLAAQPAIQPAPAPVTLGPKKAGVIRIGVAAPRADLGQGFQGANAAEPIRALFSQYLTGPKLEIVSLAALLPQQIDGEAKEKACDYVVYSSIAMKKAGGAFGLLKSASSVATMMPMASPLSAGAAMAGAGAGTAAAGLSSQIKARSEVIMEYHVFAPGSSTATVENKSSLKAKSDGEDVITPLIEAAATSILGKVSPKS